MIKYNNKTINDFYFDTSNLVKVYRNNAVCYYKISGGGDTPTAQTPCYAVVDDISQYSDTEFEDVFNKADESWYKRNNLNQYEKYGVYGSGRTITTYEGKLTIDDGYEYQYSGNSWVNVGEISGGTASLPNVPFVLNYNAKNYDALTHTIKMTDGQLNGTDAFGYTNSSNIVDHSSDGYITISNSSMRIRKVDQDISLFNRQSTDSDSDLTIVCKAKTTSGESIITNRDSAYNWMYRLKGGGTLTLHGTSETGGINWNTSNPDIMSVRTYYDNGTKVKYNNWTQNTSSTPTSFTYGSINTDTSKAGALFVGYSWSNTGEQWSGDFYWVYMAQANLTDEQIQQVIDYNEASSIAVYPLYYDEIQDPPTEVSFSSMTEALSYECPYVGLNAIIDNTDYLFCDTNEWLTKYVYQEVSGDYICRDGNKYKKMQEYDRNVDGSISATTNYIAGDLIESGSTDCTCILPYGYTQLEYIENTTSAYINLGVYPYSTESNSYEIETKMSSTKGNNSFEYLFSCESSTSPYVGCLCRWSDYYSGLELDGTNYTSKNITDNQDGTSGITITCNQTNATNTTPLTLWCGLNGSSPWRYGKGKIYTFKVTIDNSLVRDMIPCKRDSDSMIGMYDIVNDVFYYPSNSASYQLVGGAEVPCGSNLPSGYVEVEYIENPSMAYIDSGFKPNQDTRILFTFKFEKSQSAAMLVGAGGWDRADGMLFDYEQNLSGTLHISWGGTTRWSVISSIHGDYDVHTYDWNKNEFYLDNTMVDSTTYKAFQCSDNLGIFSPIQYPYSPFGQQHFACGKLYDFKIYDNGTLIRDFVPCINPSNAVGVYDIVNNVFYTSANPSYQLVAGPTV